MRNQTATSTSTLSGRQKKLFDESPSNLMTIASTWQLDKKNKTQASAFTQTPSSFFQLQETEIQCGKYTQVIQEEVKEESKQSLIDFVARTHPEFETSQWEQKITEGMITVDCEVTTEPAFQLEKDAIIEYVGYKIHQHTQTDNKSVISIESVINETTLLPFLQRISPLVHATMKENISSKSFEGLDFQSFASVDESDNKIKYTKQFFVDLEKKKIVFPDWTKAKHTTGIIIRRVLTRNKERVYDIEYDDGAILSAVKEEYIRLLDDPNQESSTSNIKKITTRKDNFGDHTGQSITLTGAALTQRLTQGIRVHAKVVMKNGQFKYLPGRIIKVGKSMYDVECEGNRIEAGLTVNDLCIGLMEGQRIEARKPNKIQLQATGMSWNATGSWLGVTYGRLDVDGWCDEPGALAVWNVFSTSNNNSTNSTSSAANNTTPFNGYEYIDPTYLLDHASCLTAVAFHPIIPSIVCVGSFNGELLLYDLTNMDNPCIASSPIIDYAHKEAIVSLQWIYHAGDNNQLTNWFVGSVGSDGRLLFWQVQNKLQYPIRGYLLFNRTKKGAYSSQRGRMYPLGHGASACAISSTANLSTRPTWIVIGQEAGSLLRGQLSKLLFNPSVTMGTTVAGSTVGSNGGWITAEIIRSLPTIEELFPSIQTVLTNNSFLHRNSQVSSSSSSQKQQQHIGCITSIDYSPYHRQLYLTAGSDGHVQLHHVLQPLPLRTFAPAAAAGSVVMMDSDNSKNNNSSSEEASNGGLWSNSNNHNKKTNTNKKGHSSADSMEAIIITSVKFSLSRPFVFAVATNDGRIMLYDLYEYSAALNENSNSRSSSQSNSIILPVCVWQVVTPMFPSTDSTIAPVDDSGSSNNNPAPPSSKQGKASHGSSSQNGTHRVCLTALSFHPKRREILTATDWIGRVHVWKLPASLYQRKKDELIRWERFGKLQMSELETETANSSF
jgi:hypothetical protein